MTTNAINSFSNTRALAEAGRMMELHGLSLPELSTELPSTDQLLLLFSRASDAHTLAENAVKERIRDAIDAKNTLTTVSSQLQTLEYHKEGDNDVTSAGPVKRQIDALLEKTKDPDARAALQNARKIVESGGDDNLTRDEVKKIDGIISNTVSSIDGAMQIKTMALKQENDYFSSITSVIKEIMDANTKVFSTIMARG